MRRTKFIMAICVALTMTNLLYINVISEPKQMPDGGMFDAQYYANMYPDVKEALGTNETILYNHYLEFGMKEGRLPYASTNGENIPTNSGIMEVSNMQITLNLSYGQRNGVYTGQMLNGLPHGRGTFVSINPYGEKWIYSGEWDKGHMNGNGTTVWESTNDSFVGTYMNDIEISGTYSWGVGDKLVGQFTKSGSGLKPNGVCTYIFANGGSFTGTFSNSFNNAVGKYTNDGVTCDAQFINGKVYAVPNNSYSGNQVTSNGSQTVKSSGGTVYVTEYGQKYHRSSACAGSKSWATTIDKVGSRTPCKKCA